MQLDAFHVFEFFLILLGQFVIAGGLAAFSVVSRMHEDRVFPRTRWGAGLSRQLHRDRLHLILILVGLEVAWIVIITYMLPGLLQSIFTGQRSAFLFPGLFPLLAMVLIILVSTVGGIGWAIKYADRFAYLVSFPLWPFYILLKPVTAIFLKAVSLVFPDLPREIASPFFLVPGTDDGGNGFIEENGSRLMRSIVEFGEKKVREVMVPRIDVFALDKHLPLDEIRESVAGAGHSRVPVYDGNMDRIVGILYVKDLVRIPREGDPGLDIDRFTREAYFVPEAKKIEDLLREFQVEKKHMAIVVDEYGGTSGIVTLEDILEEIVGEIRDEYDHEPPPLRQIGENHYLVEGKMNLDDLCQRLNISLPSEDVDTLGGFLYNLIGRVPQEGEEVDFGVVHFQVNRLEGQRIAEVSMLLSPQNGDVGY
ncbi:MAG: HlyC/CorC family transporter [Candidatus Krumholzibacteriota bacterium]|nr:HlyC/CorC family transporter [Candidatus Krumholzibacteriota bacterium]